MVLSFSRHLFVYPVLVMDQQAWLDAYVAAFEFLSGTPARIVLDNLRAGVIKPDIYDPKLNRAYSELGAHYGCPLNPARVGHPKDKPCAPDCSSLSGRVGKRSAMVHVPWRDRTRTHPAARRRAA